MNSKTIKLSKHIQLINLQDEDVQFIYKPVKTDKINLFQIEQQRQSQKPTTRQFMIQRLKNQAQELKEMKKTISSVSMSRLNQMKRIINQNLDIESQSQYQLQRKFNKQDENFKFTKSIKDLVKIRLNDQSQKKELQSEENVNLITQHYNNPQISQVSNERNTNQQNKTHNQSLSQQQGPNLITNKKSFRKIQSGHLRKISTQINNFDASEHSDKNRIISAYSQRRLRPSTSNISRSKYSDEMTLFVRKQLHQMQAKQKILKNKVRIIENQTQHKLNKKIKENHELLQKHQVLYEIIQTRMQKQRQKTNLSKRKLQERRFIHEGKTLKVNIQKLSKKNQKKQEQQIVQSQAQESLLNLAYRRFLKSKEDLQKQQKIAFRMSFSKDFQLKDLVASKISGHNNSSSRTRSVSTNYM